MPNSRWKHFRKDAVASALVIPISLMFALGLSAVAHTPSEAGIIAVVVGGIITSTIGGSYVNISGPGVHSAAVWMMGSIILGEGQFTSGYLLMLASGVIVGALMIIVGLTRQIHRLDFIPISVKRGIVTMLGIWIIISQIPPLLGADAYKVYDSIGEMISTYPSLIEKSVQGGTDYWISGLGLLALLFMIFYSSYQNRLIRTLPAPLWLLIGGIAVSGYIELMQGDAFLIHHNQQVYLDDFGIDWLHFPEWSALGSSTFWLVTLGFFMVTLNESVTNLRTIDRLDVMHRRSNINREIAALGAATMVSCGIGGLNVTATVAQSSTNVQLGAMSRWGNLINALGVLALSALAAQFIESLLLPIISAMMIYIGYRMSAPSHMRGVAEMGWEDYIGFVTSLVVGWIFGIAYGLLAGIAAIFVLQLITSRRPGFILRFAFRPNTLLYREDDSAYLLSIKHYASFMNLGRIREKIDSVPSSAEITVDFSLTDFVDKNVLQQLEYYEEIFMRRGGRFEIVGIDDLPLKVHHAFSPWMPFGEAPSESGALSNRQESLARWSAEEGYHYYPKVLYTGQPFYSFQFFRTVRIEAQRNRITGELNGHLFILADIDFHQGEFIARGTTHSTMLSLHIPTKVPQFVLDRERLLDRVAALAGFNDINFENHPEFSNKFRLRGNNEEALREFFSDELIQLLSVHPEYHLEARGNQLLIFEKERLAGANEIKGLVSFAAELTAFL